MKKTIKMFILFFAFLIGVGTYTISAQNPPSHAKAHGVKKKYRYYPQSNVYFDPSAKKYTYLTGGRWITGLTLPNTIRLTGSFNDFDFDGDDPWKDNKNHKEKYKPIKSNDIKKAEKQLDKYDSNSNKGNGKKNKH